MSDIRVRFAPSPTGSLHVGGARTALFNWLYARHTGGKFLLRIEDTDRKRSTPEAVQVIFDGLRWLGLDWDEDPLFQSTRLQEHKRLVDDLLALRAAYRCFCHPDELARQQEEAQKRGGAFFYPGTCRNLNDEEISRRLEAGQEFAVRFKVPPGKTEWDDAVRGRVIFDNADIEDFILLRRDGTPVYQVAVVADDAHMKVTHVIRGDDHVTNTPKQILIYRALDLPVPRFAHIPLILGPDKKRLSKRHGAASVMEYRDRGILPEAMRNFLALLGWSPGDDREVMTLDELIEAFTLERIHTAGAVFDETKLLWMNARYIAELSPEELWRRISPYLQEFCTARGIKPPEKAFGLQLAALYRERLRTLTEAPEKMAFFLADPRDYDAKGARKFWKEPAPERLRELMDRFARVSAWDHVHLEEVINGYAEELGVSRAKLIHPLRLALTGGTASPGIFDVMTLLGRDTCLRRIRAALETLG